MQFVVGKQAVLNHWKVKRELVPWSCALYHWAEVTGYVLTHSEKFHAHEDKSCVKLAPIHWVHQYQRQSGSLLSHFMSCFYMPYVKLGIQSSAISFQLMLQKGTELYFQNYIHYLPEISIGYIWNYHDVNDNSDVGYYIDFFHLNHSHPFFLVWKYLDSMCIIFI